VVLALHQVIGVVRGVYKKFLFSLWLCLIGSVAYAPPNLFIQQEHEGNLTFEDPRGSVFTYYEPVEVREDLIRQTVQSLWWPDRTIYWIQRKTWYRKDAWTPLPVYAKLRYLKLLEQSLTGNGQENLCWNENVCRLLVRKKNAPPYLDDNPRMEAPPGQTNGSPRSFLFPEIITRRGAPALSVNEAIGRAERIIGETGHAGIHFHVFVRIPPERLRAQLSQLGSMLQLMNDKLYLEAARESFNNIVHPALHPWHQGRTQTVERIIREGNTQPHTPEWNSPNNEKSVNLAFRYWGMEDGMMVVSLELRGVPIPTPPPRISVVGLEEGMGSPRGADLSIARALLTQLMSLGEALLEGRLANANDEQRHFDLERAESVIRSRAERRGLRPGDYFTLAQFSRFLTGDIEVSQGFLFPFSTGGNPDLNLLRFIDRFLELSAGAKRTPNIENHVTNYKNQFWEAYRRWALEELPRVRHSLSAPRPTNPVPARCSQILEAAVP